MPDRFRRAATVRALLTVFVVALLASACGSGSAADPGSTPTPSPTGRDRTIAVLAPLTGDRADDGRGVLQSVRSVVAQRAADLERAGFALDVLALDDRGEQSVGQQQATRLADDPSVIGVVGSVSSLVDEGVQPILNSAGLAMVSPGGGAPWLTMRGKPAQRPFATYFRLCAQDRDQGTAAAIRAKQQRVTKALVIDDGTVEHTSIASAFVSELTSSGGVRVTRVSIPRTTDDVIPAAAVRRIARFAPQTVMVSASAERFAAVRAALTTAGVLPRYVTTFPPPESTVVDDESEAWTGVVATTIGALAQTLPGRPTLRPATPGPEPLVDPGIFGAAAADAATLLIDALVAPVAPVTASTTPVITPTPQASEPLTELEVATARERARIVNLVDAAVIDGATGPVSFNRFGDVRSRPVGFFTFDGREWVPQPAVVVGPGT